MMQGTEHPAASLDDRISEARSQVQRTPESHPEFERRLHKLIRLVDQRDARLVTPPRGSQRLALRLPASLSRRGSGARSSQSM